MLPEKPTLAVGVITKGLAAALVAEREAIGTIRERLEEYERALLDLVERGRLVREAFELVGLEAPEGLAEQGPVAPPTQSEADAEVCRQICEFLDTRPGAKASDVVDALGISRGTWDRLRRKLADAGRIQSEGVLSGTRYWTTQYRDRETAERNGNRQVGGAAGARKRQVREEILRLVGADPGALSEERIVQASDLDDIDREEVAFACGELMEEGEIRLLPDATYAPAPRLILPDVVPLEAA